MAADSDGCSLITVVTCEGDLGNPEFPAQLNKVVVTLNGILGDVVKVRKLEPWNSVRVTLSIPREAALRLRQLASEGSQLLKSLGILSVQVEGDQVISLRIAAASLNSEPQEIILRTAQDGPSTSSGNLAVNRQELEGPLARLFSASNIVASVSGSASEKVQFKSPNVVCPPDSVVPKVAVNSSPTPSKNPFPFTSMNQAIHSREVNNQQQPPPPPYPQQPPVSISSPLLVNLLQNDGTDSTVSAPLPSAVKLVCSRTAANSAVITVPQTSVPVNSSISPSALTKHQTNSTSSCVLSTQPPPLNNLPISRPLPPPPPYPTWASPTHLPDLTPSLTDLKADDLDHLLPSLEHDLAHSPPDLPEELINSNNHNTDGSILPADIDFCGKNFLINPLTGELEPQSSGESDTEDEVRDVFTDLPSPAPPFSDEDTNSTSRTENPLNPITDQSDSDTRSSIIETSVKHRYKHSKTSRDRGRDSPAMKSTEKIKLRLKLEKSEPVNPAYKVDVSFINTQQPKKASVTPTQSNSEELRVPPLHISLRGRNHVVITNKKRTKLSSNGEKLEKFKVRRTQEHAIKKKSDDSVSIGEANVNNSVPALSDISDQTRSIRLSNSEPKKLKKPKTNHEHKDTLMSNPHLISQETKVMLHNFHYKEKLKERRGSDSELARANKKFIDSNGIISEEKQRRLSQSDTIEGVGLPGSTNIGTVVGLPKPRKEKIKNKELNRNKSYSKNLAEKLAKQQVTLPTGEIDMEAKFKQRLMEGVNRPPHRTELPPAPEKPPPVEDKLPESDKCNTPERKGEIGEKQVAGRSPNGGAQGEDSGIESMDALSEKSPNQASQSPHADLPESALKPKTQVPDMMEIEAQLAKMEGLNGAEECCVITSALQDSLKQGAVTLSVHSTTTPKENKTFNADVSLMPIGPSKDEDLEPLPVRVAPPLYTYSNPEKGRDQEDSMYDEESDSNNTNHTLTKSKSLLEQLLIDIPTDQQHPDSPSPATRSVRTRASSKLNSPEINLNSPVTRQQRATTPANKRKRHESDSSNHSTDEGRNKKIRKCSENSTTELVKVCVATEPVKINNVKKPLNVSGKGNDESSDSDEPLIEKMRKSNNTHTTTAKSKVKTMTISKNANAPLSTRRSVRSAMPAQNTRSKGDNKPHSDAEAVRRKTRSAVSDTENKRKKEVK